MTTKNNGIGIYRGIYENEYDAFTNYMNILGDFLKRVKDLYSDAVENDELNSLYTQIANMGNELNVKDNEISRLRARLEKYEPKEDGKESEAPKAKGAKKPAAAKKTTTAKKAAPAKKATTTKKAAKEKK